MLAICGCWDQASGVPAPRAATHAQAGLLVSYRPLAARFQSLLRPQGSVSGGFPGCRGTEALATRSEERTPPTRVRPFVVGETNKTNLPRGFRGLCFDHCYYGRFCGPIPRFNFFLNSDFNFFFVCLPGGCLSSRFMLPQAAALMRL